MQRRALQIRFVLAVIAATPLAGFAVVCSGSALAVDDYVFVDSFESNDCSLPLSCTTPAAGLSCIAGSLTDAAAAEPLHARFNVGLACGGGAVGGPCDLAVAAHDALQFVQNPSGSVPLAAADVVVDGCGRYRFTDLEAPSAGFVAIVADDAPGGAEYMPAAMVRALGANDLVDGATAVAARLNDVAMWGLAGSQNYLDTGVLLLTFSTNGVPTVGVSVAGSGTVRYFSDANTQRFFVNTAATSTGPNGSALVVGTASFASGGESGGCAWPSVNATSATGVVIYMEVSCR